MTNRQRHAACIECGQWRSIRAYGRCSACSKDRGTKPDAEPLSPEQQLLRAWGRRQRYIRARYPILEERE